MEFSTFEWDGSEDGGEGECTKGRVDYYLRPTGERKSCTKKLAKHQKFCAGGTRETKHLAARLQEVSFRCKKERIVTFTTFASEKFVPLLLKKERTREK